MKQKIQKISLEIAKLAEEEEDREEEECVKLSTNNTWQTEHFSQPLDMKTQNSQFSMAVRSIAIRVNHLAEYTHRIIEKLRGLQGILKKGK